MNKVKSVLISGIGYGRNAKIFKDNGMTIKGIEMSQTAIDIAREHFGNNLIIYHGLVTEIPFDNNWYGGIICYGLIYLLDKDKREKLIQDGLNQLTEDELMVFTVITKGVSTYGQEILISKDRFERFGGVKILLRPRNH